MNKKDNEESTSSPANDASTPTYVNHSMRLVYFHVLQTMFKYRPPSVFVISFLHDKGNCSHVNYCGIVPHYVDVKFFEANTMAVSVHGKLHGSIIAD